MENNELEPNENMTSSEIIQMYKNHLDQGFTLSDNNTKNQISIKLQEMHSEGKSHEEMFKKLQEIACSDINILKKQNIEMIELLNDNKLNDDLKLLKLKDIFDEANRILQNE